MTGTLADVSPSLVAALGVEGFDDVLGVGEARGVALLLVDGLGAELLDAHADRAPALAELAARGRRLVAGFPATTAVSVTSLGTGLSSGEHGIVGYSMGVPPLDDPEAPADVVLNTLRWCAHGAIDPVDLRRELPPEQVQAAPTVLERAARAGVAVTTVAPEIQRRSGLTRAALRGGRFHGVSALGDLGAEVLDALATDAAEERTFCYAYHGDLDMIGHTHGPGSRPWRLQLAVVDRLVAAIAEDLPSDTVLAVVADHGMIGTDPGWRIDIDTTPALLGGVRRLAGEARVRHVFVADGALDDVTAAWREELGEAAWVRTRDEAIAEGWFGPEVADTARGRIGDVVAAAQGNWTLVRSRIEPMETGLVGHHGSLTDAEQHVPFLLARS
ncbi:putative AlkP superfamily pyrophosphatase or phosphodiesterase [Actinomycetospora succinea]|uniref:Putative AlkP superfamily pyrophosphatase or phosphodiesterase n=1 Tax=Actinomycetospora succinea TaxID=663603 RepID=A0A4R6VPB1_9PSEU|nr:nucleotide pyrophosphatase/phosphodiesterase family protein [Actinomycetospora succinea]TDQ61255.1 putative AlkP superfamily pyrophosphatase or phosphodiesterase [Actinomycetospora succinea]